MAKKNGGKVIQMLSPENYIRKKARSLPILECLVNEEWQEQGFANLVIARSHTNGNVTACIYLVDLYCLGVKDTHFLFNSTQLNYEEKFGGIDMNFKPISYTLAHNIVYAGLEFAEEYGFKPHKDFTSITRFMLEEDTEDIEMIDIECGKDGNPFYVSGPYDDDLKIRKIIAQLEKTAGPGNYDYLLAEGEGVDEDELEDNDDDEDEFKGMSLDEKKKFLLDAQSRMKNTGEADTIRLINLSKSIFAEFVDPALYDQYFEEYRYDLDIEINNGRPTDEMLGIDSNSTIISDTTRYLFLEIAQLSQENSKKASKLLAEFREQTPDIPASYYLELLILQDKKQNKYLNKLEEYSNKFPDYSLIKILWIEEHLSPDSLTKDENAQMYNLESFFAGRNSLHGFEIFKYIMFQMLILGDNDNVSRLEAFYYAYAEIDLLEEDLKILDSLVVVAKIRFAFKLLTQ